MVEGVRQPSQSKYSHTLSPNKNVEAISHQLPRDISQELKPCSEPSELVFRSAWRFTGTHNRMRQRQGEKRLTQISETSQLLPPEVPSLVWVSQGPAQQPGLTVRCEWLGSAVSRPPGQAHRQSCWSWWRLLCSHPGMLGSFSLGRKHAQDSSSNSIWLLLIWTSEILCISKECWKQKLLPKLQIKQSSQKPKF